MSLYFHQHSHTFLTDQCTTHTHIIAQDDQGCSHFQTSHLQVCVLSFCLTLNPPHCLSHTFFIIISAIYLKMFCHLCFAVFYNTLFYMYYLQNRHYTFLCSRNCLFTSQCQNLSRINMQLKITEVSTIRSNIRCFSIYSVLPLYFYDVPVNKPIWETCLAFSCRNLQRYFPKPLINFQKLAVFSVSHDPVNPNQKCILSACFPYSSVSVFQCSVLSYLPLSLKTS